MIARTIALSLLLIAAIGAIDVALEDLGVGDGPVGETEAICIQDPFTDGCLPCPRRFHCVE